MLGQVHDHIVSELGESSRTDIIFVLTAIVFNLLVLGINSGLSLAATEEEATTTYDLVLTVFIVLTVLVNIIAVAGLMMGRRTRGTLLGGLVAMYRDNDVDKYYDPALISNYRVRYLLFHRRDRDPGNHGNNSPPHHPNTVHEHSLTQPIPNPWAPH